jgi:Cysteine-rich CWC
MSRCTRCGTSFTCGMADAADGPCWCTALPPLPPSAYVREAGNPAGGSCFCPACLRALLEAQQGKDAVD